MGIWHRHGFVAWMIPHTFPFDPSYGYTQDMLLRVQAPPPPPDFESMWRMRYARALSTPPQAQLHKSAGPDHRVWSLMEFGLRSVDGFAIGGWALVPRKGPIRRGFIAVHGYDGRSGPDWHLPFHDAVLLFPCMRGFNKSQHPSISSDARWHVLHDIDKPDRYIHGRCVEDLWMTVSAMLQLFPETRGAIGFLGISFGGGIVSLAFPWEQRVERAHVKVPSFGNWPLRLQLQTVGSGEAVRSFAARHGVDATLRTLQYYDSATAALFISKPLHVAAAKIDPYVAPPGQFAIYNAVRGPKHLYVMEAGHLMHPTQARQDQEILTELAQFFSSLGQDPSP